MALRKPLARKQTPEEMVKNEILKLGIDAINLSREHENISKKQADYLQRITDINQKLNNTAKIFIDTHETQSASEKTKIIKAIDASCTEVKTYYKAYTKDKVSGALTLDMPEKDPHEQFQHLMKKYLKLKNRTLTTAQLNNLENELEKIKGFPDGLEKWNVKIEKYNKYLNDASSNLLQGALMLKGMLPKEEEIIENIRTIAMKNLDLDIATSNASSSPSLDEQQTTSTSSSEHRSAAARGSLRHAGSHTLHKPKKKEVSSSTSATSSSSYSASYCS